MVRALGPVIDLRLAMLLGHRILRRRAVNHPGLHLSIASSISIEGAAVMVNIR